MAEESVDSVSVVRVRGRENTPGQVLPKLDPVAGPDGLWRCNARLSDWAKDGSGYCTKIVKPGQRCRYHGAGAGRPAYKLGRGGEYLIPEVREHIYAFLEDPAILDLYSDIASQRSIASRIEQELVDLPERQNLYLLLGLIPLPEEDEEGKLPKDMTVRTKDIERIRKALVIYETVWRLDLTVSILERLSKVHEVVGRNVKRMREIEIVEKGTVTYAQLETWYQLLSSAVFDTCDGCSKLQTLAKNMREVKV